MGILDTIGLMATVVLAVPVAFLGADFLLQGELFLGAGFLTVAALMIAVEEYVTTPTDIPGAITARAVGKIAVEPEEKDGDGE